MQIQEFDRTTSLLFKAAIEAKLQEAADDFGVSLAISNIKLPTRSSMNMTMTASIGGDVKLEDTPGGRMFHAYCLAHGIPKSALGETVQVNRTMFKIIGWAPSARKYCIEAERVSDGRVYRLTIRDVKHELGV